MYVEKKILISQNQCLIALRVRHFFQKNFLVSDNFKILIFDFTVLIADFVSATGVIN